MKAVVYLDTGIEVDVPAGTDPDSVDGYALIRAKALEKIARLAGDPGGWCPVVIKLEEDDE
jgi:hypothetical protein